jgi:TonB family protein
MVLKGLVANLQFCIADHCYLRASCSPSHWRNAADMSAFRKHLLSLVCLLGVSTAQGQDAAVKTTEAAPERQLQRCDSYYPLGGRAAGITVINFELTSKGGMNNVRVVRPSGNADLDSAAIKCASDFMPAWNMEDQHAISGGVVANDSAAVEWKQDGPSMLSFGCPYPILPLRLNQQGKIVLSLKILNLLLRNPADLAIWTKRRCHVCGFGGSHQSSSKEIRSNSIGKPLCASGSLISRTYAAG